MTNDAIQWRTSTKSGGSNCVQVAFVDEEILVRDSKDEGGSTLRFNSAEWHAFTAGVIAGEFDPSGAPSASHS
jgi:hypothetical protein